MTKQISFNVSRDDQAKVSYIASLAAIRGIIAKGEQRRHEMNLIACHANGCPLDLQALAGSSVENMAHDLAGIDRHLDRETGELRDCFLPRCAA